MGTIKADNYKDTDGKGAAPPVGSVIMFAGAVAPNGFMFCDGSAVSRTTYSDLFDTIGTSYGVGDGSTTFNLPNFEGLVPRGVGTQTVNTRDKEGPSALGEVQEDQMQRIAGVLSTGSGVMGFREANDEMDGAFSLQPVNTYAQRLQSEAGNGRLVDFNSANSAGARTSTPTNGETRVSALGVHFLIRY